MMSFSGNAYYQQLGEAARDACVRAGITTWDQHKLTKADIVAIVEYFHGQLHERSRAISQTTNGDQVTNGEQVEGGDQVTNGEQAEGGNQAMNAEQIVTTENQHHRENTLLRKAEKHEADKVKFTIEYSQFRLLELLHELGHAFLELDNMDPGEVRGCDDVNGGINEQNATKFARAFLMPRDEFEKVVLKNSKGSVCDIDKVAEEFGIDYWQVVSQGRQLQIW